jgi:hypothetical protein
VPAAGTDRAATRPTKAVGLAAACLLAGLLAITSLLHAQSTPGPTVRIAATLNLRAAAETAIPIDAGPAGTLPRGSIVRVQGLPPMAALSAGYSIGPGSWAIPVGQHAGLKIMLPGAASGNADIIVTVVASDGTVLAEARSHLVINPQADSVPAAVLKALTPQATPPSEPAAAAPALSAQDRERALRLMKRGDEHLAQGGVAQARLFYERAADAGLALGAMALAATYDPAELDRLGVQGLQPDPAAAAKWYTRARQLGAAEATQRLQRLGAK